LNLHALLSLADTGGVEMIFVYVMSQFSIEIRDQLIREIVWLNAEMINDETVYDLLLSCERGKVIGYVGIAHKECRNATSCDLVSMASITFNAQLFHPSGGNFFNSLLMFLPALIRQR